MLCSSKSIYRKLWRVLSYDSFYLIGSISSVITARHSSFHMTRGLDRFCCCLAKDSSLFFRILAQLDKSYRDLFLAIVTRKYVCDIMIIGVTRKYVCDIMIIGELRSRTTGNSPTVLRNRNWLIEQRRYMTDCFLHKYRVPSIRLLIYYLF